MATSLLIISLACLILTVHAFDPRTLLFRNQDNQQQDTRNQNTNYDQYRSQNQNNRDIDQNSNRQDNDNYGTQHTQGGNNQNDQNRNQNNYQNYGNRRQDSSYDGVRGINDDQDTRRNHNQGNRNQDNYQDHGNRNQDKYQNHGNRDQDNYQNHGNRNQDNYQNHGNRNQDNYQNHGNRHGNIQNQGNREQDSPYEENPNQNFRGTNNNQNQRNRNQDFNRENDRNQNQQTRDNGNRRQDAINGGDDRNSDSKGQNQGQVQSTTSKNILKKIGKGIENEIKDIKQPVLAGVVNVASSQCDNLKKIAGVAYEQLDGEDEPDVSQLTLRFICGSYNITYNITTAARDIPAARNHDPRQRLYIFLHGFTDDPTKSNYNTIRQGLFSEGRNNVLGLDASSLIHWMYLRSTTYVQFIGEKLGEVLAAMVQGGVDRSNIHIIGHSLGAHIAGFTGKQFQSLTGYRVGRISGLDPAGPCFAHVNDSQRLNATDADFVDVIHTDSGVYGIKEPVGQVDYYPNEGKSQPGCFFETCSHSRAVQLFADSIQRPESFPAVKCDSWERFEEGKCENEDSYMGFASKPGTRGNFYLQTKEEAPFGKGPEGSKFNDKKGVVKSITKLFG